MASRIPTLLITPGDPDGIGAEIVWKTIKKNSTRELRVNLLCIGAVEPFKKLSVPIRILNSTKNLEKNQNFRGIQILPAPRHLDPSKNPGFQSGWAIEEAVRLIQNGDGDALVTGPISKERLRHAGFPFSGHTDFLGFLAGNCHVTMMLANSQLRVSLVTVHHALSAVSGLITRPAIRQAVIHTLRALVQDFGISKPKIAVLALNPHAGEAGILGTEEQTIIQSEISFLQRKYASKQIVFDGPHPADTFFAKYFLTPTQKRPDAIIAMYHDQGLIPVKMVDFSHTVNLSLGLPFIRTSVDHGVAFDIAGKNKADPRSFESALKLALSFVKQRMKGKKLK